MPKEKDQSIETLRGLAILLVVAGYVIQHDISRALGHDSPAAVALRFSYFLLRPIRMPLFTVISAYLYASSPATRETFKKLVTGKARRIMIPFLAVSTIQYFIFAVLPMQKHPALHEIHRIYIWPHEQLWFLYSIFEIFILVGVMDIFKLMDTPKKWFACLAVSSVFQVVFHLPEAFSVDGIKYLLPFFILGYGFRRYPEILFGRKALLNYTLALPPLMILWTLCYKHWPLPQRIHDALSLAITFSAVPLVFHLRRPLPFLAWFGYYAFGIHLFNRICVSATRTVFEHAGYHDTLVQFAAYMALGVAGAIVIQLFLERFSITRKLILGMKEEKKYPCEILPLKPVAEPMDIAPAGLRPALQAKLNES